MLVTSKSPDAFRTISEVADHLDIPQHVLRFWETRFSPIRPLKRGGGRRYYRPDDVDLLKGIRQLLYGQGYTIKGVQRILKEEGPRFVQGIGRGEHAPGPMRRDAAPAENEEGMFEEHALAPSDALDHGAAGQGWPSAMTGGAGFSVEHQSSGAPVALSAEDLDMLRSALDELLECERVLETLRRT